MRQAVLNRVRREGGVVFPTGKPFFLRSRDDAAVDEERGRRVVVIGRDAEHGRHGAMPPVEADATNGRRAAATLAWPCGVQCPSPWM